MASRVMPRHDRVLGGDHETPPIVHQQRAKRMITVLSSAGRDFDCLPDKRLMDRISARRALLGQLRGCLRGRHTGKRNCYRSGLQKCAAIRALHSFVVPRLGQCMIYRL